MKTISDKAIELYPLRNIGGAAEFQQAAFKKGVEFAQRWILFENERPPQFEQVLVKCKGKGAKIYLSEYLGYGNGSFTDTSSTVTHWRPIELK